MKSIRNSAKAIIIRNGSLLAIEAVDDEGPWFMLPGGGQEPGETLIDALKRECLEEIGTLVVSSGLAYIREYIAQHHEFAAADPDTHQIEFMFRCNVPDGYSPVSGHKPDVPQIGVKWLPVGDLMDYRLYPLSLRSILVDPDKANVGVYLGDVN